MSDPQRPSDGDSGLQATLGRLCFDPPDPSLRQRTLRDVREVLVAEDPVPRRRPWKVVGVPVAVLLCLWALAPSRPTLAPPSRVSHLASIAQWLDLDEDLARHIDATWTTPRRARSTHSKTLGNHDHGRFVFDAPRF